MDVLLTLGIIGGALLLIAGTNTQRQERDVFGLVALCIGVILMLACATGLVVDIAKHLS
jgi:hypothetical protein